MDPAGRLVVPKALRERLGLPSGGDVELTERDGVVELAAAPVHVRVARRPYGLVLDVDDGLPAMTDGDVRQILEPARR